MAFEKRGSFAGHIERNGKGDDRRPTQVEASAFEANGAQAFGDDWLIPPVLRRRRAQETSDTGDV